MNVTEIDLELSDEEFVNAFQAKSKTSSPWFTGREIKRLVDISKIPKEEIRTLEEGHHFLMDYKMAYSIIVQAKINISKLNAKDIDPFISNKVVPLFKGKR